MDTCWIISNNILFIFDNIYLLQIWIKNGRQQRITKMASQLVNFNKSPTKKALSLSNNKLLLFLKNKK